MVHRHQQNITKKHGGQNTSCQKQHSVEVSEYLVDIEMKLQNRHSINRCFYYCTYIVYFSRSLIAFKWLLRAIEHHGSSVIYGINFIVNGFSGDQDEENFIAFVEHSKLANVYLNHSTKLLPEVCFNGYAISLVVVIPWK